MKEEIPPSLRTDNGCALKEERKLCIASPRARLVSAEWHQTNIHSKTDLEGEDKKSLQECDLNNSISESFLLIGAP